MNTLRELIFEEDGAAAAEYALILAIIGSAIAVAGSDDAAAPGEPAAVGGPVQVTGPGIRRPPRTRRR